MGGLGGFDAVERARPVLLTGASGLLGRWLLKTLPSGTTVVALNHRHDVPGHPGLRADLRDARATAAAVRQANPSLIIHAAYAKNHESIVGATEHVVDAACAVDADIMLISTDAVFCGDGITRDETSAPDPISDYGRWKAAAERVVERSSAAAVIVRLSLLVSVDPDDHVVREIRASAARDEVTRWFTDETRQPASASEVAAAIWRIAGLAPDIRGGTWHLPGPERLTRYETAERVVERLGIGRELIEPATSPGTDAVRPRHVVLADVRARSAIGWQPSPVLS